MGEKARVRSLVRAASHETNESRRLLTEAVTARLRGLKAQEEYDYLKSMKTAYRWDDADPSIKKQLDTVTQEKSESWKNYISQVKTLTTKLASVDNDMDVAVAPSISPRQLQHEIHKLQPTIEELQKEMAYIISTIKEISAVPPSPTGRLRSSSLREGGDLDSQRPPKRRRVENDASPQVETLSLFPGSELVSQRIEELEKRWEDLSDEFEAVRAELEANIERNRLGDPEEDEDLANKVSALQETAKLLSDFVVQFEQQAAALKLGSLRREQSELNARITEVCLFGGD